MAADTNAFREELHDTFRGELPDLYVEYREKLAAGGTVEDYRKAVEMHVKTLGLEAEKKTDPNAGLPVFNFIFENGGVQATMVAAGSQPAQDAEGDPSTIEMELAPQPQLPLEPEEVPASALPDFDVEDLVPVQDGDL